MCVCVGGGGGGGGEGGWGVTIYQKHPFPLINAGNESPGPKIIKLFLLLINMKMSKTVGLFIFSSKKNFKLSYVSKEEFATASNLR